MTAAAQSRYGGARRTNEDQREALRKKNTDEIRAKLAFSTDVHAQNEFDYLEEKENIVRPSHDIPSVEEMYLSSNAHPGVASGYYVSGSSRMISSTRDTYSQSALSNRAPVDASVQDLDSHYIPTFSTRIS